MAVESSSVAGTGNGVNACGDITVPNRELWLLHGIGFACTNIEIENMGIQFLGSNFWVKSCTATAYEGFWLDTPFKIDSGQRLDALGYLANDAGADSVATTFIVRKVTVEIVTGKPS